METKYIKESEIPENRLPIYYCNITLVICETKNKRKNNFVREVKEIVLKGLNEADLKAKVLNQESKYLSKTELKYCKIISCNIEIIKFLSFGILE